LLSFILACLSGCDDPTGFAPHGKDNGNHLVIQLADCDLARLQVASGVQNEMLEVENRNCVDEIDAVFIYGGLALLFVP